MGTLFGYPASALWDLILRTRCASIAEPCVLLQRLHVSVVRAPPSFSGMMCSTVSGGSDPSRSSRRNDARHKGQRTAPACPSGITAVRSRSKRVNNSGPSVVANLQCRSADSFPVAALCAELVREVSAETILLPGHLRVIAWRPDPGGRLIRSRLADFPSVSGGHFPDCRLLGTCSRFG